MQMQSMAVVGVPRRGVRDRVPAVLRGRRLWLLLGSATLAAGVAWQWNWLLAIGVLPFLLSVAPCAAMCALGLCASKLAGGFCKTSPADANSPTVTKLASQNDTSELMTRNGKGFSDDANRGIRFGGALAARRRLRSCVRAG